MSLNRTPPPIHTLNRDVLWHIFEINANMFAHAGALETTRRTSQVCRAWRVMLLSASRLWARLVDLDTLPAQKYSWRRKLIRRGKTAPLWIKGSNLSGRPDTSELSRFFLDLIEENWHRIQVLVVQMPFSFPTKRWATLFTPAPQIEPFKLDFCLGLPIDAATQHESALCNLFARNAPMLHNIRIKSTSLDFTAPWWKQLRTLELSSVSTVHGVLEVLGAAPNLKHLQILGIQSPENSLSRPVTTSVPNLEYLEIAVDMKVMNLLLDSLRLAASCAFVFSPTEQSRVDIAALSIFIQQYFQFRGQPKVCLYERAHRTRNGSSLFPENNDIQLRCSVSTMGPQTQVKSSPHCIEETFSRVSRIVEYTFHIDVRSPADPFISLMQALPSVETLAIEKQVLIFLNNIQRSQKSEDGKPMVLFPFLRMLQLQTMSASHSFGADMDVVWFVKAQENGWHPLEILDLIQCHPNSWPDVRLLEQEKGLKILVNFGMGGTHEYICGRP